MLGGSALFARHLGKSGQQNQNSPNQHRGAENGVRLDHAKRFRPKVTVVSVGGVARGDLLGRQLNPREDENGANERAGDRSERVDRLRKIQAALGAVLIAELRDEGIGSGFEKGKAAGDHEESEKKKCVAALQSGGPEEKSAGAVENQA